MATLFKDLYKPVKNVLNSGYNAETCEFKVNAPASNGLRWNATGVRANASGTLSGDFEWEHTCSDRKNNLHTITGTMSHDGTVNAKSKSRISSTNFTFTTDTIMQTAVGKSNGDKMVVGTEYADKNIAANIDLTLGNRAKPMKANVSALATYEGLSFGGQATVDLQEKAKLANYDLGVKYAKDNLNIAMLLENQLSSVKVGVAHTVRPDLTLAVQFAQALSTKADEPRAAPVATIGLSKRIDADSSIKAKTDTTGKTAVAYQLRVNPSVVADVTVESNINSLDKRSKLGVSLTYTPKV